MSMQEDSAHKTLQDDKSPSRSNSTSKKDAHLGRDLKSIKNKLPVLKLRKEKVPNQTRFAGDGVAFKAKLIGVEEIDQARGDKLCQETLQRLKQVVKTSGTHKQRISLTVSLSGVKLLEEKTGVLLYHHPVHQISFISQDIADDRAFGYICSPTVSIFHFVAIKTEKSASLIVLTLRDLFQVVLDIKKKHKLKQQQLKETDPPELDSSKNRISDSPGISSKLEVNAEKQLETENAEEAIYAEVGQFQSTLESEALGNEDILRTANDLLCGDLLDLNFEETQPIPTEAIFLDKQVLFQIRATPQPEEPKPSNEAEVTRTEIFPVLNEFDKYAVFEEIDNVSSIFENPAFPTQFNSSPIPQSISPPPPPISPPRVKFSETFDDTDSSIANNSFETDFDTSFSTAVPVSTIFAELDPLAKDRPFVDKKVFFNEIKNPPRKNLKDLMTKNSSFNTGVILQSHSGVSIISNLQDTKPPPSYPPPVCANPFVSDSVCSSPPRVPPRVPFDVFSSDNQPQTKGNPFSSSTSNIELPPPNTPPPVLPPSEIVHNVFATAKSVQSQALPKTSLENNLPDNDGVFFRVPAASPAIAVSAAKKSALFSTGSSITSSSSVETGAYSSSWSVSSKFSTDESKNECQKLGSEKFHSSEEIAFSEIQNSPSKIIKRNNLRPHWNTFDLDDLPTTTETICEVNVKVNDEVQDTDTIQEVQNDVTPDALSVEINPLLKEASPSFGSQIFGTSSTVEVPPSELSSPEEMSIFRRKQDPFADEFFQSLAK